MCLLIYRINYLKMIRNAIKEAYKSNFDLRIGAVIVKSGRVLSKGYNKTGVYTKYAHVEFLSIHAEVDAIIKCLKSYRYSNLIGAKIYIAGLRKNGRLLLSKPCTRCAQLIRNVGIKKVYYTTNEQTVECYSVKRN